MPDHSRLAIDPGGRRIATYGASSAIVWNLDGPTKILEARPKRKGEPMYHPAMDSMSAEEIARSTPPSSITSVAFAGGRLVVGTSSSGLDLYDLDRGAHTAVAGGRFDQVLPDRRRALTRWGTRLELWDLAAAPARLRVLEAGLSYPWSEVIVPHPDGKRLIVAYRSLRAYDLASGELSAQGPDVESGVSQAVCHPGGAHVLAAAQREPQLLVWNLVEHTLTPLARRDHREAEAIAVHPPTGWLLALGQRALDAWNVDGTPIHRVHFESAFRSMRVSPAGVVALWGDETPLLMIPA